MVDVMVGKREQQKESLWAVRWVVAMDKQLVAGRVEHLVVCSDEQMAAS